MAEIVVVVAVVGVLALVAIPRLAGIDNLYAMTAADRLVAALHHARTLAQRQGVPTSVVIASSSYNLTVSQNGTAVYMPNNDTLTSYLVDFDSGVTVSPTGTIVYGVDGIPSSAPSSFPVTFSLDNGDQTYTVTLTSLGFAYGN